jgi:hypothetical protein
VGWPAPQFPGNRPAGERPEPSLDLETPVTREEFAMKLQVPARAGRGDARAMGLDVSAPFFSVACMKNPNLTRESGAENSSGELQTHRRVRLQRQPERGTALNARPRARRFSEPDGCKERQPELDSLV